MVFVLTVRQRLVFLSRKQLANKNLLKYPTTKSFSTSQALSGIPTTNKPLSQKSKLRRKSISILSGIVIVGTYISLSSSNSLTLDTLPGGVNGNKGTGELGTRFFSTSSLSGNAISQHQSKQSVAYLSDEQVSQRLRQYEESYLVKRGKGVTRYDICQLPSNNPIEDDRSEEIVQLPIVQENNIKTNTDWMFWGIFDGHAGWTTSAKLRDNLINYVIHELGSVFKPNDQNYRYVPNSETIDQAIKNGFLKLDDEIVNKNVAKLLSNPSKAKAAELLMPALSGSCGLVSFYDTNSQTLKVAVTGDSRALLGSFQDNQWTVKQLSIDQTGSSPSEVARIISEHPDEPNVIRNGRVLGTLEPSRAFGDCRYKLSSSIQKKIYSTFFGRTVPPALKSPPYVTAEPVVTTTKINPENNDFMVMASDGLYEMLSSEEIVGLVVKWMEQQNMIKPQSSFLKFFNSKENKLPTVIDVTNDKASKQPFRKGPGAGNGFLLEDDNVSTHLIRNALSNGGSKEQTAMLLAIPSPTSRRYRDDLTVTVVFFGNEGKVDESGKLEINPVATAGGADSSKPKL